MKALILLIEDGLEIRIPKIYESLYNTICDNWQQETKLVLEFVDYRLMALTDVNNYLAITTDGKVKTKGRFEVDKKIGSEPAYHKDNSFRIVPLAIQEFFVNGTPIDITIRSHKNIYDFCGRQKFKGEDFGSTTWLDKDQIRTRKEQKVTRYYISSKGSTFNKHYTNGKREQIHRGYTVNIFNDFIHHDNFDEYNIDYSFYLREAMKEIDVIMNNQIKLEFD